MLSGDTPRRDGSHFDGRDDLIETAAKRAGLTREEQAFVQRGINTGVFEHPGNASALRAGIVAGVQKAIEVRGQLFQNRKDLVEMAIHAAVKTLVVRISDCSPTD